LRGWRSYRCSAKELASSNVELSKRVKVLETKVDRLTNALKEEHEQEKELASQRALMQQVNASLNNLLSLAVGT